MFSVWINSRCSLEMNCLNFLEWGSLIFIGALIWAGGGRVACGRQRLPTQWPRWGMNDLGLSAVIPITKSLLLGWEAADSIPKSSGTSAQSELSELNRFMAVIELFVGFFFFLSPFSSPPWLPVLKGVPGGFGEVHCGLPSKVGPYQKGNSNTLNVSTWDHAHIVCSH